MLQAKATSTAVGNLASSRSDGHHSPSAQPRIAKWIENLYNDEYILEAGGPSAAIFG
jgi:hypothetical protein